LINAADARKITQSFKDALAGITEDRQALKTKGTASEATVQ
jgi:hypothetical protein